MIIESSKPIRVNADCLRAIVSFFDHDDPLTIVRFSRTCRAAKMIGDQLFPKFKQMELRVNATVDLDTGEVTYTAGVPSCMLPAYWTRNEYEKQLLKTTKLVVSKNFYIKRLLSKLRYAEIVDSDIVVQGEEFKPGLIYFVIKEMQKISNKTPPFCWVKSNAFFPTMKLYDSPPADDTWFSFRFHVTDPENINDLIEGCTENPLVTFVVDAVPYSPLKMTLRNDVVVYLEREDDKGETDLTISND
ncbi:unnamed protein product [Enterobius vermicularis]|uniref:F-box domain-containing protein n=1 Tax=Enterobius vermicularis TaxID=51028 RepID=A0A0N4VGM3_ENTVE|nr:unnamed protein product [Enterobius vermicularis]